MIFFDLSLFFDFLEIQPIRNFVDVWAWERCWVKSTIVSTLPYGFNSQQSFSSGSAVICSLAMYMFPGYIWFSQSPCLVFWSWSWYNFESYLIPLPSSFLSYITNFSGLNILIWNGFSFLYWAYTDSKCLQNIAIKNHVGFSFMRASIVCSMNHSKIWFTMHAAKSKVLLFPNSKWHLKFKKL